MSKLFLKSKDINKTQLAIDNLKQVMDSFYYCPYFCILKFFFNKKKSSNPHTDSPPH